MTPTLKKKTAAADRNAVEELYDSYRNRNMIGPKTPPRSIKVLKTPKQPVRAKGETTSDISTMRLTTTQPDAIPLTVAKIKRYLKSETNAYKNKLTA
jgi:hypothetical protein